jgi:hypothetical protein
MCKTHGKYLHDVQNNDVSAKQS